MLFIQHTIIYVQTIVNNANVRPLIDKRFERVL